jgi:hypothetical protein
MNDLERRDEPARGRPGGAWDRQFEEGLGEEAAYEPGWYRLANMAPVSEEYQVFDPKAGREAEPQLPPRRGLDELLELLAGSGDPATKRAAADAAIGIIQGIGIDEESLGHLLLVLGQAEANELPDPKTLARLGGAIDPHRLKAALDLPDERRVGAGRLVSADRAEVPETPGAEAAPGVEGTGPGEPPAREAVLDRRETSLIEREAAVLEREVAVQKREAALAARAGELEARETSPAERETAYNGSRSDRRRAG